MCIIYLTEVDWTECWEEVTIDGRYLHNCHCEVTYSIITSKHVHVYMLQSYTIVTLL